MFNLGLTPAADCLSLTYLKFLFESSLRLRLPTGADPSRPNAISNNCWSDTKAHKRLKRVEKGGDNA